MTTLPRPAGTIPRRWLTTALLTAVVATIWTCQGHGADPCPVIPTDGLLLPRVAEGGRLPFHRDPYDAMLVVEPQRQATAGEVVEREEGPAAGWQAVTGTRDEQSDEVRFQGRELAGAYLQLIVDNPAAGVYLLRAAGHGEVRINGQPRVGNPYGSWYELPIWLQAGKNQLVFHIAGGQFSGQLVAKPKDCYFSPDDITQPDWLRGATTPVHAAIPIINATDQHQQGLVIEASVAGRATLRTEVPSILPLALHKAAFRFQGPADVEGETIAVRLRLLGRGPDSPVLDELEIEVPVSDTTQRHQRTFVSQVDGSVQYYCVVPSASPSNPSHPSALYLTLHGAGVEGSGQAAVYSPKSEGIVVAATNRRPFGFDWEDWGRRDAMEVLTLAQQQFEIDPNRVYLTGHSMGGHGTWHLAATFPDRFAAIGPSAGWISFRSYTGRGDVTHTPGTDAQEALRRASSGSDTEALVRNLAPLGVYVLHGDADDNVPVTEARRMRGMLAEFHTDFAYYERRGAGHWWGNKCCDWPPMFDFFRRHVGVPTSSLSHIDFTTVNPGVSSTYGWASILDQQDYLAASRIQLTLDREKGTLVGTTQNVASLLVDLPAASPDGSPDGPLDVELDSQRLPLPWARLYLSRIDGTWEPAQPPVAEQKNPDRYGPFKAAFDHNFVFVYATQGEAAENEWALAKARYDAEQFWYRGNGSVEVVADTDFQPNEFADRSVILYGNAETNAAWDSMLAECPLRILRDRIVLGDRHFEGDQLAALFVYPRIDSHRALVGVVGGTGVHGARCTNSLRYFRSGVGYPDYVVFSADYLQRGADAVRAAGYWDAQWQL